MNKLYIGKITSTHGIKGEIKIKSNFERKDLIFKENFIIYIEEQEEIINSYRPHKGFDMVTLKGYYDINDIYKYVGKDVYIDKNDLNLKDDEYLVSDLIGFEIRENNEILGKVKEIYENKQGFLLKIKENFIIPLKYYIVKIDKENKIIYTKGAKELIL